MLDHFTRCPSEDLQAKQPSSYIAHIHNALKFSLFFGSKCIINGLNNILSFPPAKVENFLMGSACSHTVESNKLARDVIRLCNICRLFKVNTLQNRKQQPAVESTMSQESKIRTAHLK